MQSRVFETGSVGLAETQLLFFLQLIEIPVLNVNSTDPDQTPHFAASNLGLHCLSMSLS